MALEDPSTKLTPTPDPETVRLGVLAGIALGEADEFVGDTKGVGLRVCPVGTGDDAVLDWNTVLNVFIMSDNRCCAYITGKLNATAAVIGLNKSQNVPGWDNTSPERISFP